MLALAQDALPSPTLLAWRAWGDRMGNSTVEMQPWGPDPACASLHVSSQLLCREQSLGSSGSKQQKTTRCFQTCQGWCESLPLLGIREMVMSRGEAGT